MAIAYLGGRESNLEVLVTSRALQTHDLQSSISEMQSYHTPQVLFRYDHSMMYLARQLKVLHTGSLLHHRMAMISKLAAVHA